tara:strand:- start:1438 stop:2154 length:717 start_codon:yes stop_codon:yes gene_type:complete
MMKFKNILKFTCGLLLITLFIFTLSLVEIDYQPHIQEVEVHYLNDNLYKNFSKQDIVFQAKLFFNTQDSLKDINTSVLEDLILEYEYINKAEVYLDLAKVAHIYISFREPFVKVLSDDRIHYYDDDGVLLPALLESQDLLVISGDLAENEFKNFIPIVEQIYNHDMLNNLIGGIHYDILEGFELSSKLCDLGIKIGQHDIRSKLNIIKSFSAFLSEELGCDYCKTINLKYNNQIICVK